MSLPFRPVHRSRWMALLVLVSCVAGLQSVRAAAYSTPVQPDYTKGQKLKGEHNYANLGPIGATGWVWALRDDHGPLTRDTRQIQIRDVIKGTPADGKLKVGDVILGVLSPAGTQDGLFDWDARKALAAAITAAEEEANGGKLVLYVWRPDDPETSTSGKASPVTIVLPVKGSFSAISPWECEKTKHLVDAACQRILDRGFFEKEGRQKGKVRDGIPSYLDALGLLATGEEKYLPAVREYVRALCPPELKCDFADMHCWFWAYKLVLVAEYYHATKDEYVLPGLTEMATKLAMGRSGVGTWSHGTAVPSQNGGRLYGTPSSYGAMNQVGLTCTIGIILAQKCGVRNEAVDSAIKTSSRFLRWFVDKGMIPYGDHDPWHAKGNLYWEHDNNGKCSQAAVMYNLLGDKEATAYYTRMALASYHNRESGHTGHFFARTWGVPGAACGGAGAAQSFIKNIRWFTELERCADGGSVYQHQLADIDHYRTTDWSTTGCRLLLHCLPRQKLFITGKGGYCIPAITGDELKEVVAMAEYDPAKRSTQELLKTLGSWSPEVRMATAIELGLRDDNVVPELLAMLKSPNRYARYGACFGLHCAGRGSAEAVDALCELMATSPDLTLRYWAAESLKAPGKLVSCTEHVLSQNNVTLRAVPALLKQAATLELELDPFSKLHFTIAKVLFDKSNDRGLFPGGEGIDTVDRELLIPAIKVLLRNPNAYTRETVGFVLPHLTDEDMKQLWGDVYYCAKYRSPSGAMADSVARVRFMKALADHRVKEGLPLIVDFVFEQQGWGNYSRKESGPTLLRPYGDAIKPYLSDIEAYIKETAQDTKATVVKTNAEYRKLQKEVMKADPPQMISIAEYIKNDPGPVTVK